jgi:hypothetical protein
MKARLVVYANIVVYIFVGQETTKLRFLFHTKLAYADQPACAMSMKHAACSGLSSMQTPSEAQWRCACVACLVLFNGLSFSLARSPMRIQKNMYIYIHLHVAPPATMQTQRSIVACFYVLLGAYAHSARACARACAVLMIGFGLWVYITAVQPQ